MLRRCWRAPSRDGARPEEAPMLTIAMAITHGGALPVSLDA
jgi:hypothetical protein